MQQRRGDLDSLANFNALYRAYVQTEMIFDDVKTKALNASIPAGRRDDIGFDVEAIDWEDYFQNVHFPAITEMTRAFAVRPAERERPVRALPQRSDVVAVFDLEGTVVDTNLAEQYLWVRSAGFRKAAWPGEFLSLVASVPTYLRAERRDRGEFIRVFLRRYKGMPVARLEKVVSRGYGDTLLRHTRGRGGRAHPRTPGGRPPHHPRDRIDRHPRIAARPALRRDRGEHHAPEGRRAHRLPRSAPAGR